MKKVFFRIDRNMKFPEKLSEIFLEIARTSLKNYMKFSWKIGETYFKILWNFPKNWVKLASIQKNKNFKKLRTMQTFQYLNCSQSQLVRIIRSLPYFFLMHFFQFFRGLMDIRNAVLKVHNIHFVWPPPSPGLISFFQSAIFYSKPKLPSSPCASTSI